ncbi:MULTISPECIES: anti-phage dCTP deaminase [Lonsdalea]|uniref:CMP deaminase n=3 Tax=Lonsdalea TaxID=1082702 RepID=A0ACD1J9K5_9GAMM|nr:MULTISPECIES: anti-phage dCTP deaminase [Lonsdalea]RAT11455.1 CMP deaminase [Lonsdalea quercina]RAT17963.1 CMP deaminase [Lonsdalea populi]RAT22535.1 CMP deaminase [Lonsdalea populi]RAT31273.1 CMP deaminase [Lonsdalea populi]RAT32730.1 CMP deaminase [Lonsdalea populi]
MSLAEQKKFSENSMNIDIRNINSTYEAKASVTPELIIALCGPIGSPLHETAIQIGNILKDFNYSTELIRLSDLIRLNICSSGIEVNEKSRFLEIDSLIKGGDSLRQKFGNDILAKMAIAKIGGDRIKTYGDFKDLAKEGETPENKKIKSQRICHVIDSVKNKDELELLQVIYGNALFSFGVFSPLEIRKKNLEYLEELSQNDIEKLIDTDSGEEFSHGQSVRDTFPKCDFFLRVDESIKGHSEAKAKSQISENLLRLFKLIFRTAVLSPTLQENAMYAAASASRNSACLSRQVGAAVTSENGELLSTGWNDVPNSDGGLYGKPALNGILKEDHRCYAEKGAKCHNDIEKYAIAEMIVESLINESVLTKRKKTSAIDTIIKHTRLKDLIEFSRAVHAEMHSILIASRVAGEKIVGGKIFVTTYPCHACARHIIAAGIKEVYYIEPYRKSLATRLHSDAMTEAASSDEGSVRIIQYDGVAPRRFLDLFESESRKGKGGMLQLQEQEDALPSTNVSLRAIPRLEQVVVAEISSKSLQLPGLAS